MRLKELLIEGLCGVIYAFIFWNFIFSGILWSAR